MDARSSTGLALARTLASLHLVDLTPLGAEITDSPTPYVVRQLKRWMKQWEASGGNQDEPRVSELHDLLLAQVPSQSRSSLVHGDYGLHNCLIDEKGSVVAVLDWEIATVGDPLTDLGYAVNGWGEHPNEISGYTAPSAAPGFVSRDEFIREYQRGTQWDLADLPYHRAFNYWKLAIVYQGILFRNAKANSKTATRIRESLPRRVGDCLTNAYRVADFIAG
jgi:aminoglycoside phosphotransferase (APT) family kinase protein